MTATTPGADERALDAVRALEASGIVHGPAVHDSRAVTDGSLYACLRGQHADGHDFAAAAIEAGAGAVLVDHLVPGVDPARRSSSTTPGAASARSLPTSPATRAPN